MKFKTSSPEETQSLAKRFAENLIKSNNNQSKGLVVELSGNLGSGKTLFTQGFLKAFGIKKITSPTFVILKHYSLKSPKGKIKNLYHVDCYRLKSAEDIKSANLKKIIEDPASLVLIEWPEKIKGLLPRKTIKLKFDYGEKENERLITLPFNE